jgi:hypothetical protein
MHQNTGWYHSLTFKKANEKRKVAILPVPVEKLLVTARCSLAAFVWLFCSLFLHARLMQLRSAGLACSGTVPVA